MFVFSLESCRRDAIDYGKTTSLQLKLTINEKPGVLATKGAIEDFSADVYVMYENTETKFVTFFADPYNEGVYTIDPFRGDQICASYGIPFHIRIEAEIGGLKLRGESEIIVVVDESVIVNIEMYAGAFRIYTRAPRIVDIYGDIVHTGGAIYELQPEQTATYAGVICAPSSSCGSLTEETFTIDNLQTLSGYRTDGRAFGVDDGVNGNISVISSVLCNFPSHTNLTYPCLEISMSCSPFFCLLLKVYGKLISTFVPSGIAVIALITSLVLWLLTSQPEMGE